MWGNIFKSEAEFLSVMDKHDHLIQACARGEITFDEFIREYDGFYGTYALDGHESDNVELAMFGKYRERIAPHEELGYDILAHLCSDVDAVKPSYINAGRFGTSEALRRIKILNAKYFERQT